MKNILTLLLITISFGISAQTVPSKSKAEQDIKSKAASINKQLTRFGDKLKFSDMTLAYAEGHFRKYSQSAAYYGYQYVSQPDMVYYLYSLTSPKYPNGDQFVFDVYVKYDSYRYETGGYRKPLGKYTLHSVNIVLKSFEGNDLSEQHLFQELNKFSIEKGKKFQADKYEFVRVDSVTFTKTEKIVKNGATKYRYLVDIYGFGVDFMYAGSDVIEYEIKSSADVHGVYSTEFILDQGKWKLHDITFFNVPGDNEFSNVKEDPMVPAYKSLNQVSLKTLMMGEQLADEIPKTTYRAANDLKRLLTKRLDEETRENFVKGELLTQLFSTTQGQEALDIFYGFKKTMKDYKLSKIEFKANDYASMIKKDGETKSFRFSYRVKRKLTPEELKAAKKDKTIPKEAKQILKYRADGYLEYNLEVKLDNNQFKVVGFDYRNNVKYYAGTDNKHPMYLKP